jgi:PAT family beta-lactamase induction signal transducer AmpG
MPWRSVSTPEPDAVYGSAVEPLGAVFRSGPMTQARALPPVWLMGAGFLPLGASGALMLVTIPQLMAADHMSEATITSVTAVGLIPGFVSFLFGPLLDWRFSRRLYAIWLAAIGAACTFAALAFITRPGVVMWLLFASGMAIGLCVSAVGGWFGNLTRTEDKGALGAWFTVCNIGAGGLVAASAIPVLRGMPYLAGAGVLSLLILAALPLYVWTPCPPADGRLAHESFREFARDLAALLRRPTVLWTLLLFAAPGASFALTNQLGGLGRDFATSERLVGLLGGVGAAVAGVVGSLMIPQIGKRVPPRPLYLLVGGLGAAFTLSLILLPRTPGVFGLAMLGENVFQAAAFSVSNMIVLRTIGHENPLAATQFGLLNSAGSLPLAYMQAIDGQAYGLSGVNGSFLADAAISGGVCILLGLMLWLLRRRVPAV